MDATGMIYTSYSNIVHEKWDKPRFYVNVRRIGRCTLCSLTNGWPISLRVSRVKTIAIPSAQVIYGGYDVATAVFNRECESLCRSAVSRSIE